MDPAVQEAFRNLLNPPSGANTPFIQEDQRWIQENLSHAGKPVSWQDQVRMQQARQQAHTQQQMQQAQLEAAKAQREMYEAQTRMLRQQQWQAQRAAKFHNADYSANTAYEFLNNPYRGIPAKPHQPPSQEVLHLPGIQEFKNYPHSYMLKEKLYPDVTRNQRIYVKHIIEDIQQNDLNWIDFLRRFPPGAIWDLKGQSGIPPAGHWALYRREVVSDAYLANNAFGHAMAKAGFTLKDALDKAQLATIPGNIYRLRVALDQPEDQAAIISGWFEYYTGDPWPNSLPTPFDYEVLKQKYPQKYKEYEWHFQEQHNIIKLLQEAERLHERRKSNKH